MAESAAIAAPSRLRPRRWVLPWGLSAYLIRSINVPLLRGEVGEESQPRLISRWHRGNAMRLGLLAATEILLRRVEASVSD